MSRDQQTTPDRGSASGDSTCGIKKVCEPQTLEKRQIYGAQAFTGFRADRKMAIWPIEDPGNVNERRAKLGFTTTVEEYAADLGAVFDINDQLPGEQD